MSFFGLFKAKSDVPVSIKTPYKTSHEIEAEHKGHRFRVYGWNRINCGTCENCNVELGLDTIYNIMLGRHTRCHHSIEE